MTEFIETLFSTIFGDNVILATILISIVPIIELKGAIPFSMSTKIWGTAALSATQALLFSLIGSCLIVPILALIYKPIIDALKRSKLFKKLALKIEAKVNRSKNKIESRAEGNSAENHKNISAEIKDEEQKSVTANLKEDSNNIVTNEQLNVTNKLNKNEVTNKEPILEENANEQINTKKRYDKKFFIKLLSVFLFVCVPLPLTGVWTGTCVAVVLGLGFGWTCLSVISGNIIAGLLMTLLSSLGFDTIYIVYAVLILIVLMLLIALIKKLITKIVNKNKKQVTK